MNNTLYQVSTTNVLSLGWLFGVRTVGEIREHGDTGFGVFEGADGEFIAVDGEFFRATGDQRVAPARDEDKVTFACAANFDTEWVTDISLTTTLGSLEKAMSGVIDNFNHFYLVRLDGFFQSVSVMTLAGQKLPYPSFQTACAQRRGRTCANLKGSVVALYCPAYVSGFNLPGWHTHFISSDRRIAGQVADLSLASGKAAFTRLCAFRIELPRDKRFGKLDLTRGSPLF